MWLVELCGGPASLHKKTLCNTISVHFSSNWFTLVHNVKPILPCQAPITQCRLPQQQKRNMNTYFFYDSFVCYFANQVQNPCKKCADQYRKSFMTDVCLTRLFHCVSLVNQTVWSLAASNKVMFIWHHI